MTAAYEWSFSSFYATLRLSLKFISSNQPLNLEMQQEAPSQSPPHENPSWNGYLTNLGSPYSARLSTLDCDPQSQHACWRRQVEKMNQKHKLTQESCSSDNYPKNIFSDNYRAKNGSTLKIPSFLPRKLRRWFNNNQLLRCITFRGT